MDPNDPEALRRRVLATLRALYIAIEANTLEPVNLSVSQQLDARTGDPTGQQTLALVTRPAPAQGQFDETL